jgi:hypothetical protein
MSNSQSINWKQIIEMSTAVDLCKKWDWENAYIESIEIISHTHNSLEKNKKEWVSGWGEMPDIEIGICFASQRHRIRLRMKSIDRLDVWFGGDLCPVATMDEKGIVWRFNGKLSQPMLMRSLEYMVLQY